jgi:class 3 adenylate cyclase
MVKSLRELRLTSPTGPFASKSGNDKFRDLTSRLNVVEGHTKERRLAAILAADVAGYSRLVGADEMGTLNRLQVHWDTLIEPTIRSHHVRIVRIAGDGVLAEFASVVDAVECAVEMQRAMAERNAGIPAAEQIQFRMGINVGDIIVDRGDLWGDGVNVAARLEALAEPGGICVSGRVQEDVQGKLDLAFEDAGEHQLKNIARPVRVYRVQLDETASRVGERSGQSKDDRLSNLPAPLQAEALPLDRRGAVRRSERRPPAGGGSRQRMTRRVRPRSLLPRLRASRRPARRRKRRSRR